MIVCGCLFTVMVRTFDWAASYVPSDALFAMIVQLPALTPATVAVAEPLTGVIEHTPGVLSLTNENVSSPPPVPPDTTTSV